MVEWLSVNGGYDWEYHLKIVPLPDNPNGMEMLLLEPRSWSDYELIDSGNFEKLERFGSYVVARPEPQAVWSKSLSDAEWEKMANAYFKREKGVAKSGQDERGTWIKKKGMPEQWVVAYGYEEMALKMRLGLTAFKHVGLFPEQGENWNYIYSTIKKLKTEQPKVLNLFAYTGGASLAAKAAGADVTHVDSVKQVVTWSRENMELSNLNNIRWIVDDALKFVKREVKRGNRYNGIILDPPAYGRGPDGERWILEEGIQELVTCCRDILDPNDGFMVLNLYSMGFSAIIAETLINQVFNQKLSMNIGELFLCDRFKKKLPLGVFCRFTNF